MMRKLASIGCAVTLVLGLAEGQAHADVLAMGTLAPQGSPWGQVFQGWAQVVATKSSSATRLDWRWNGTAGDELRMIESMRSGQLQGAALTAVGLGAIDRDLVALEMPGLFSTQENFDAALAALTPYFATKLATKGFVLLGVYDLGGKHFLSAGSPVKTPADLGQGGAFVTGDVLEQALFGAVPTTAKGFALPAIFSNLGGSIRVIDAPSLEAEQLQWSGKITDVSSLPTSYAYGALVVPKASFDKMSPDAQPLLTTTGRAAASQMSTRIRNLDAQAYAHLAGTKTVHVPSTTEKDTWTQLFAKVRASLRATRGGFSSEAFEKAVALAK